MSIAKEIGMEVADRLHAEISYSDYLNLRDAIDEIDTLEERDRELEELWAYFGDIPMNPETEQIEGQFLEFPYGTHREEIWHWFDARHSKGVAYLLYGDGKDRTDDLAKLTYRNALCFECDADCIFNPEGICRFPFVTGREAVINEIDGCNDCIPGYVATEGI